ncbi:hypothetical protein ACH5RR_022838 [Cinchona calisaya]|uniref:Uncharacterized protein n=1 Tax=Cinchona calisaya TaxID=153742 RepID=A0ABD2ZAT1_9GENT
MIHTSKYQQLHNFFGKLIEVVLSICLAAIQRQVKEISSVNEQKLKSLESIQAKCLSLKIRKAELIKEQVQLEVEMQGANAKIQKINDEMSHNQHLMAHLATK